MSKEIYKEYFNDWIKAVGEEKQIAVNKNYIWGGRTIAEHNEMSSSDEDCFLGLVTNNLLQLKRKPKTQMINGHEVVAPRYDLPAQKTEMFYLDFAEKDGVINETYNELLHPYIHLFGWFDNIDDAIAYTNAHRENKND